MKNFSRSLFRTSISTTSRPSSNGFSPAKLQKSAFLHGRRHPKTVVNTLNLLSRIFNDAISDNYLRHSPMQGVKKPKVSRKKKGRALKPQEIRTLLSKLDFETALMVKMAILTGMRQGEQFGLFWEDIDWDRNVITVQRELFWRFGKYQDETGYVLVKPKSEQSIREIDLSPALRKELREKYMSTDKNGFVFRTSDNTPILPSNVYRRKFRPAVTAAEIQGKVRWHDLRYVLSR